MDNVELWDRAPEAIQIGPYADPPVVDRYFVRDTETGRRIERHEQRLASGGWHYIDTDCRSCDVQEWLSLPRGDGTWYRLYIVDAPRVAG